MTHADHRPDTASTAPEAAAPEIVFAALGDSTRLALLSRLGDGQAHSIGALTAGLPLTRQGVTKHLRVLEQAGIVHGHRVGRERRYTVVPEPIEQARSYLEKVSAQWDETLDRLKSFVETESTEARCTPDTVPRSTRR